MLTLALGLLVLTALGGATLVVCHLRFKTLPMPVVVGHGIGGAFGLVVLGRWVLSDPDGSAGRLALIVLGVAALGGFANLALNLRRASLHLPMVALHAVLAATGLVSLALVWLATG